CALSGARRAAQGRGGCSVVLGEGLELEWGCSRAEVVVWLEADFLARSGPHLRSTRAFAQRRDPGQPMNRLYVVESNLSITGAIADHRLRLPPSEIQTFALELLAEVGRQPGLGFLLGTFQGAGPPGGGAHAK